MSVKEVTERRRAYIDFLKAVGAVLIIIYHYRHLAAYNPAWPSDMPMPLEGIFGLVYRYGYLSVELFFVLSGFALAQNQTFSREKGLKNFIGPRLVKLYPLFFLTTGACAILQYLTQSMTGSFSLGLKSYTLVDVFFSLTMLQSGVFSMRVPFNVPAWFLTPLFVCYLLFWCMFCGQKGGKRPEAYRFLLSGALVLLGAATLYNGWAVPFFNERMARGLFAFFFGVILSYLCRFTGGSSSAKATAGAVTTLLSLVMIKSGYAGNLLLSSVFVIAAIVFLLEHVSWADRILSLEPVKRIYAPIYNLSYPLFLCHYPVLTTIALLNRFWPLCRFFDTFWFFALYVAVSFLFAIAARQTVNALAPKFKSFLYLS